jgi:hypothetical protein
MIATVSNKTTSELKMASGIRSLFYPNFIQHSKSVSKKAVKNVVKIEFADFDYKFKAEIVNQRIYLTKIEQKLKIAEGIFLHIELKGKQAKQPEKRFYIDNVSSRLEIKHQSPKSNFIAFSFAAMEGLSKINFPWINNGIGSFPKTIKTISTLLQNRQLSYRLMVLEKALKISISIPNREIDRAEIDNISYCYHSIVDRKFEFNADSKHRVGETETEPIVGCIFGSKIDLGIQKVSIIKRGVEEVESITTPTLPKNAFSRDVQALIDLDGKLDSMVMDKYFDLAGATLDGLTEEQIKAITERPRLDEEAFNF